MAPKKKKSKKIPGMPSREALLAWLTDNPDRTDKRSVARAFGLKGNQKIELKAMLKELSQDGHIEKRGKRFTKAGTLPHVSSPVSLSKAR